jgi:RNA polymerase sigma-70 factor (ECF subfamily)
MLVAKAEPGAGSKPTIDRNWSDLMVLAQDGDRRAYRALLEAVTPHVRTMARRCFREQSDVEDVVQDVLLTVHAIRHTYDPRRPFGPWLVAIANRRIIDRLRRDARRKVRDIALLADQEACSAEMQVSDGTRHDVDLLAQAIKALPPEQRQAITLLKLREMPLKQAAAASGRTIAAMKVATHRAIKNLRRLLKEKSEKA